jgi:PKD repeat protein
LAVAILIVGMVFIPFTISATETKNSLSDINQSISILTLDTASKIQFENYLKENGYSEKEIAEIIVTMIKEQSINVSKPEVEIIKPKITEQELQEKIEKMSIIKVDDDIKKATDYWILLVLNEKQKEQIIKEIESTVSDKEYTTKGYIKYLSFTDDNKYSALSKKENETIAKVNSIHEEYYNIPENATPKWGTYPTHWDLTYWAFYNSLYTSNPFRSNATIVADRSMDPDNPILFPHIPTDHYYNPNQHTGMAPFYAAYYGTFAIIAYPNQDYLSAGANLGYSSHFLEDVGNPLHTGYELEQGYWRWIHDYYEQYVSVYWDDYYPFVQGNHYQWKFTNFDVIAPYDSTVDLAEYSNQFVDELYILIYTDPYGFPDNPRIYDLTMPTILTTSQYENGLVDCILFSKIPGQANYPTDPDEDKFYEDLNGNGGLDFADVLACYNYYNWIATTEPYVLFDYNEDQQVDYDDVVALFNEV